MMSIECMILYAKMGELLNGRDLSILSTIISFCMA